jgi:hypothetical protein
MAAASKHFAAGDWPVQDMPDMPIFTRPAASGSKLHFEKTICQREGIGRREGPSKRTALRSLRYYKKGRASKTSLPFDRGEPLARGDCFENAIQITPNGD